LFVLPALGRDFPGWLGAGPADGWWRAALCAACLLLPTMLMGATLPVIARWLGPTARGPFPTGPGLCRQHRGRHRGQPARGFYLLRVTTRSSPPLVAAALNAGIAVAAFALARGARPGPAPQRRCRIP